ncbi:MAG: glycosyltransferase family 4 protein [Actinomyces ruminicola]|uniref:Glycosyltransferase Family 4 n=1 Tax=Actinomyces ruminicola TaxID=332524 RepID=A0A1G9ZSH1_9ACTO|nr:glycosyltransferase family 4 protein [Actinomyces ruminicola]MBE6481634.1 glycosyltransferase family 4 protein [Actinomyces ruminicola]SDN23871.1 Glycosyltransferase Family 4 [Actinomyces ruminicola]
MTTAAGSRPDSPLVLVAHPSPDLYGSDWQLAETITGLLEAGYRVNVALPANGPLVGVLEGAGARVAVVPFTVLRKSLLTPRGLTGLAARATGELARLRRLIKACGADLLLANTVTIPWWPLAGRAAGIPVLSHVHEAEDTQHLLIRAGLNAPLLAATRIVANSEAARRALLSAQPLLAGRTRVVHNGVAAPPQLPAPLRERETDAPFRIAMVGRLSPRKGVDVLLEAVALLRDHGVNASLEVAGSIFPGYEWYEAELRQRAAAPDLAGRVDFLGYVHPTWPVLDGADAVVVPSRQEPFGNTAVEAMHAARPLVASSVQGLKEVVDDGVTGLLVPPDDPRALADALGRLAADPALAARLARQGAEAAQQRFSVQGYRAAMCAVVGDLLAA